jgi:tRNA threonylcarbamoyladenosine biosynthesis protein TsaB
MKQPMILAVETATSACSVCLQFKGETFSEREIGNNVHSKALLPMVDSVMSRANANRKHLDAIAVGQGPGSFTGLRIGIGVAQGLAYAAQCPMIGVSSLTALAQQAIWQNTESDEIWAAIDARMGEIYFARFRNNSTNPEIIDDIQLLPPAELPLSTWKAHVALAGNAWREYREHVISTIPEEHLPTELCELPDASAILAVAKQEYAQERWVDPRLFEPDYVRNNVAKVKGDS